MSETRTVFDGSAVGAGTGPATDGPNDLAPPYDALAMLREQVEERDSEEQSTCSVEVPGLGWRLVCDITFPYAKYMEWQKLALPKNQRNGRRTNPLSLNQADLALSVLLNTCVEVQYQRTDPNEWETLCDSAGAPLLPGSDSLLRQFNVVDPRSFMRKLFGQGREARLVEASQKVVAKAGWVEGDDGDEDPTG